MLWWWTHGLVLCSAWHVRCNSVSFTHLQLMWTTLHHLNFAKILFMIVLASQKNEIWKSWNLNKTIVRIRSGLFKMSRILPDSSPEILILHTSDFYSVLIVRSASWLKLKTSHSRKCCEDSFICDRLRKSCTTVE